jgi:hypothetical protein
MNAHLTGACGINEAHSDEDHDVHIADCPKRGYRYGLTRRDGKVVMFCKNPHCRAKRVV